MSEEKKLSHVLENYIEIIYEEEVHEGAARASSIADKAAVSRSTITSALKNLKDLGYIEYSPYSLIRLTEKGKELGIDLSQRHTIYKDFFAEILRISEKQADEVACALEHVVPLDVTKRMGQFLLYMRANKEQHSDWLAEYKNLRKNHIKEIKEKEQKKRQEKTPNQELEAFSKYF